MIWCLVMREEIVQRVCLGLEKFVEAVRLSKKDGQEVNWPCATASFLVLRPDRISPEVVVGAMGLKEPEPKKLVEHLGLQDICISARVTLRKGSAFRELWTDERIAGVVAVVPPSFEGTAGAQKKGMIPAKTGYEVHAIAILGETKTIQPELYTRTRRFGREMPRRGIKARRQGMMTTINVNREGDVLQFEDRKTLLREMARIPRANMFIVLNEGYRFDGSKIIPDIQI